MSNLKRYTLYIINTIDLFSAILSFFFSLFIREKLFIFVVNESGQYALFLALVLVSYFLVNFLLLYKEDDFFRRNSFHELLSSGKMVLFCIVLVLIFLNFSQMNVYYSRMFEGIYTLLFIAVDFLLRSLIKKVFLSHPYVRHNSEKMILVVSEKYAEEAIRRVMDETDWRYDITGIILKEESETKRIGALPVISILDHVFSSDALDSTDAVLIVHEDESIETIEHWIQQFQYSGKIVSVTLPVYHIVDSFQSIDTLGSLSVTSFRELQPMSKRQQLLKTIVERVFAILLLPLYILTSIIVKLFTALESNGPILVKRVRIGRNHKYFYQYRYRIYHMDAEERIRNNKDPHTVIGRILETLHLDGLPQILNVLIGEMSFVGPKPPNMNKYLQMSQKERSLLATSPGICGYWSIENEEGKVLEDEQNYLQHWNIFKDFAIILFTSLRFLFHHSLRVHGKIHIEEEIQFCKAIESDREPIFYDSSLYSGKENSAYNLFKRVVDIILSMVGILLSSPLFLILSLLIILNDGGSPFYSHNRIGKNGKKIKVFKFRSMRSDADNLELLLTPEQLELYNQEFKLEDDPRITRIGEFLRKSSLDELPQLFNILGGSMSIIGPRPVVAKELFESYTEEEIAKLLSVKPGLTGYWQAYARNNAEYKNHVRQDMELYYVDHRSVLFDIKIFFKTISSVIKQEGAQ